MPLNQFRHIASVARAAYAVEIQKRVAINRSRDELEFLPAVLEILESPPSPTGRAMMWSLMILFLIAITWSIVGKVDVVAIAQGKVVPYGASKTVQPLEAGLVKTILVENGQHVTEGQLLVELDSTEARADLGKASIGRIDAQLSGLRARAILTSLQTGQAPVIAPEEQIPDARRQEAERTAQSAFAEFKSKQTVIQSALAQKEQELQATLQKLSGLRQMLPIANGVANDLKSLEADGYVSRHAYMEKEQARIQTQQDLSSQESYAKELEAAIAEQKNNLAAGLAQTRREQLEALTQAEQQVAQADGDVSKSLQKKTQTQLVAPVSGTVQELAIHTIGGVVTPAQPLMVVVPDGAKVEVEAEVLNQDIGFVRQGQSVEVKLDAFPYTKYGTLKGKVESISHDAVKDDKNGFVYAARIYLPADTLAVDGSRVSLTMGMTTSVEIKTEERRIIDYLLSPLARYAHEALRER